METLTKDQIIKKLVDAGNTYSISVMYADIYLEYTKASANIEEHGLIVSHPRTGNPIENPYLVLRDRAYKKLLENRNVKAEVLWK